MINRGFLLALGLVLGASSLAQAQSVRLIGEHRDWSSYAASEGSDAVCFALSKPTEVSPAPTGYTQGYLYLTNRPGQGISNEINLVAGFNFAAGTSATLSIGSQSYSMFTEADAAWLEDPSQNDALAGVIRAGSALTIQGTAEDGTTVKQTYSLSGATAASKAIDAEC